jgi:hypothetical protein
MDDMDKETGIRISKRLKNKIKRAATMRDMTMVKYLDTIVPELEIVEVKKE